MMTGFRCIGLRLQAGDRLWMMDIDSAWAARRPEFDEDRILMNVDSAARHHDHDDDWISMNDKVGLARPGPRPADHDVSGRALIRPHALEFL